MSEHDPKENARAAASAALDNAADRALELHPTSSADAVKALIRNVRTDPRLRDNVVEIMVDEVCYARVRRRISLLNSDRWHEGARQNKATHDPTQRGARARVAMRTSAHMKLMDYKLMDGKPMALATRIDLIRNAEFQLKQGVRMARNGNWFRLIANELSSDSEIVRDRLKEGDLLEFQRIAIESVNDPSPFGDNRNGSAQASR